MAKSIFETWRERETLTGVEAGRIWLDNLARIKLLSYEGATIEVIDRYGLKLLKSKINPSEMKTFKKYESMATGLSSMYNSLSHLSFNVRNEVYINSNLLYFLTIDDEEFLETPRQLLLNRVAKVPVYQCLDNDDIFWGRIKTGIIYIKYDLMEIIALNAIFTIISSRTNVPRLKKIMADMTEINYQINNFNDFMNRMVDELGEEYREELRPIRIEDYEIPTNDMQSYKKSFKIDQHYNLIFELKNQILHGIGARIPVRKKP